MTGVGLGAEVRRVNDITARVDSGALAVGMVVGVAVDHPGGKTSGVGDGAGVLVEVAVTATTPDTISKPAVGSVVGAIAVACA